MSEEEAWTLGVNQSFVLWLNHHRRRHEGRFHSTGTRQQLPAVLLPLLCLHSRLFLWLLQSSIHFCVQENTHFARPLPVLQLASFSAVHSVPAEPKQPACNFCFELAPDAMQGERFGVLLICFFLVCFKNQKYCSFKYCALHRIFCHKLVNIYIFFQYSDIYFHIYRTIKCFLFTFFLLFSFLVCFFWEIPENVCWQLPSFHKSKHCDSLFLCFCDKCVRKISILTVLDNTAKPKQSARR